MMTCVAHILFLLGFIALTSAHGELELKLIELKNIITSTKNTIWKYWDIDHYPKFLEAMHIPDHSWNVQKAKFMQLLLNKPKDGKNVTFAIAFGGTSVTAGHGKYVEVIVMRIMYKIIQMIM